MQDPGLFDLGRQTPAVETAWPGRTTGWPDSFAHPAPKLLQWDQIGNLGVNG